jgi:hypothetical protein
MKINDIDRQRIEKFLYMLGYTEPNTPVDESQVEQLAVLLEAFAVFVERNKRYRDVWKKSGWKGSLFDIRKKVTRMWSVFWHGHPDEKAKECDDAIDSINFAAFFVRNVRDNNELGDWG